jgi:hypothetical protein
VNLYDTTERCDMGVAFKLLCDEYGRVTGVEPGDPKFIEVKAEDILGAPVEAVTVGQADPATPPGPVNIKEVRLGAGPMPRPCCLRYIGGRWVCTAC